MISNGGCDPFHYLQGRGGLGYKPSPPYMHGLGYDYNLIDGSGFTSDFNEDEEGTKLYSEMETHFKPIRDDNDIRQLDNNEMEQELQEINHWLELYEENIEKVFDPYHAMKLNNKADKLLESKDKIESQLNERERIRNERNINRQEYLYNRDNMFEGLRDFNDERIYIEDLREKENMVKKLQERNLLKKAMNIYKDVNRYENIEHPQNIRNQVVEIANEINEPLGESYETLVERLRALRHANIGMNNPQLIAGKYNIYDATATDENGDMINWELKNYAAEWPPTKKFGGMKATNYIQDYQTLKKNYSINLQKSIDLPIEIDNIEKQMENPNIPQKEYDLLEQQFIEKTNEKDYIYNNIGIKIQKNKFDGSTGDQVPIFHRVNGEVKLYNIFPKKDGVVDYTTKLRNQDDTKVKSLIHLNKGEYIYDLTGDPNVKLKKTVKINGVQYYKLKPNYKITIDNGTQYYNIDPKQLNKIKVEKMT